MYFKNKNKRTRDICITPKTSSQESSLLNHILEIQYVKDLKHVKPTAAT